MDAMKQPARATKGIGMAIALLSSCVTPAAIAGVHRCTSETGEVTFSDAPCPTGTTSDHVPTWKLDGQPVGQGAPEPEYNPYSLVSQAQMIEVRERRERRAADLQRIRDSDNNAIAIDNTRKAIAWLNDDDRQAKQFLRTQQRAPQWVLDDLAQVQALQSELVQYADALLKHMAEEQARARLAQMQATAQAALASARQAEERARQAEIKAQEAGDAAREPRHCTPDGIGGAWCR